MEKTFIRPSGSSGNSFLARSQEVTKCKVPGVNESWDAKGFGQSWLTWLFCMKVKFIPLCWKSELSDLNTLDQLKILCAGVILAVCASSLVDFEKTFSQVEKQQGYGAATMSSSMTYVRAVSAFSHGAETMNRVIWMICWQKNDPGSFSSTKALFNSFVTCSAYVPHKKWSEKSVGLIKLQKNIHPLCNASTAKWSLHTITAHLYWCSKAI